MPAQIHRLVCIARRSVMLDLMSRDRLRGFERDPRCTGLLVFTPAYAVQVIEIDADGYLPLIEVLQGPARAGLRILLDQASAFRWLSSTFVGELASPRQDAGIAREFAGSTLDAAELCAWTSGLAAQARPLHSVQELLDSAQVQAAARGIAAA